LHHPKFHSATVSSHILLHYGVISYLTVFHPKYHSTTVSYLI
jgi:hypothetical protein